jgi:primosomal protein N' (replication factor Y) (superfamily II helicase)
MSDITLPHLIQVLVLRRFPFPLTYAVPSGMELKKGDIVEVPIGNRKTIGVVWADGPVPETKRKDGKTFIIKDVTAKYPLLSLSEPLQQFITKVAEYCATDIPSILKMVLSVPKALEPPKKKQKEKPTTETEAFPPSSPKLSEEQQQAADILCEKVQAGGYSTTLLDGVTGSGKTEVYFAAIEEACKQPDAQVLILLPEIILTSQWVRRFKERFGVAPLEWHSGLTPAKRVAAWRQIVQGQAPIVVGARSALFLPYKNLKLIIVDEEHDGSFKQEEGVIYHGRDMAVVRGFVEKIPVILASATPSIETVNNVLVGKYQELKLPGRFNASMPNIEIIDMRKSEKQGSPWISQQLARAVESHLQQGQQVLLFLNRRGYAPLTLCKKCGYRFHCTSCSGWLVRHESPVRLMCHQCGHHQPVPKDCPECHAEDSLVPCGPGIQRIGEAVKQLWPSARIVLMDSGHLAQGTVRDDLIQHITKGEVDIIIGTQVIAKGHHFPKLSLVGIIDADVGLSGGDLRAAERCFQLLHQVSGRAGREKTQGYVLIQSYMPENSVIQALAHGDRDAFVASELYSREITQMPPFTRLMAIIISGHNKDETERYARHIMRMKPPAGELNIFGPVPAALFLVRKKYRYRILIQAPTNIHIQRWVLAWLASVPAPRSVAVKVDVDPYNFN